MKHECHNEKLFDLFLNRLDKIEVKIDNLLQFKWKVIGFIAALTTISTLLSNYFL
jgi:uncharacterized membrane protein